MFQGHQRFHKAGRSSSSERVPYIGFDAADNALSGTPIFVLPESAEASELDRVADWSAGRVAFDELNIRRIPAGLFVGGPHCPELAFGTGCEQVCAEVVRESDAGHDRVNVVAVVERVLQTFEYKDASTFADDESVASFIKWRTIARRRKSTELRKTHLRVEAVRPRNAPRQHRIRAPGQQLIRGQLERIQ